MAARRSRFVKAATVRRDLSDGDWIEIKERLTYGEQRQLATSSLTGTTHGLGTFEVDMARVPLVRIGMWVVDWSFCDEDGKSVPVNRASIAALEPETAEEILAELDAYQAERDADPNSAKPDDTNSNKT